jgi:hypothetical protein
VYDIRSLDRRQLWLKPRLYWSETVYQAMHVDGHQLFHSINLLSPLSEGVYSETIIVDVKRDGGFRH